MGKERKLSLRELDAIEKRIEAGAVSNEDVERLLFTVRELLKGKEATKKKAAPETPLPAADGLVEIFTDGACEGNPGPGGWGAIVRIDGVSRELSGGEPRTTNNRMELTAAIEALKSLPHGCTVTLTTDSQYLKNGITSWIHNWKRNGWRTADRKPVKNAELWSELDELNRKHQVEWRWVRGHSGHPENERCDELATGFIRKMK